MAILPTDMRILFTNYDIITYFLNLASCSEHFISIKHRILATLIYTKKSFLIACIPLTIRQMSTIGIIIFSLKSLTIQKTTLNDVENPGLEQVEKIWRC